MCLFICSPDFEGPSLTNYTEGKDEFPLSVEEEVWAFGGGVVV